MSPPGEGWTGRGVGNKLFEVTILWTGRSGESSEELVGGAGDERWCFGVQDSVRQRVWGLSEARTVVSHARKILNVWERFLEADLGLVGDALEGRLCDNFHDLVFLFFDIRGEGHVGITEIKIGDETEPGVNNSKLKVSVRLLSG